MYLIANAKIADSVKSARSDKGLFYLHTYLQGWTFFTHNVSSFIILSSLHSRSSSEYRNIPKYWDT